MGGMGLQMVGKGGDGHENGGNRLGWVWRRRDGRGWGSLFIPV